MNDKKLSPQVAHILQEHDEVRLGVPVKSEKTAVFVWTFHKQHQVVAARIKRVVGSEDIRDSNNVHNGVADPVACTESIQPERDKSKATAHAGREKTRTLCMTLSVSSVFSLILYECLFST